MRTARVLAVALLAGIMACSASSSTEDGQVDNGSALTASEAANQLDTLIHNPQNLKGVGDAVAELPSASGKWTFHPYRVSGELADSATASLFLISGPKGEVFLVDVTTGAAAGVVPSSTSVDDSARTLQSDLQSHALQGTGASGLEALKAKVTDVVGGIGAKLQGGIIRHLVTNAYDLYRSTHDYFFGSDPNGAPATIAGKLLALGKQANVDIKSIATGIVNAPLAIRNPTSLEILAKKTTGKIATTLEDGTKLIAHETVTVWTPESDPDAIAQLAKHLPAGAQFIVPDSLSANSATDLAARGFKLIWVVPSKVVEAIGAGTSQIAIKSGDAIIESSSEEATRTLARSANMFLVKPWDASLLKAADQDFMKSPIFRVIDAFALHEAAAILPKIVIVAGDLKVTASDLVKLVAHSVDLLKTLGIKTTVESILAAFDGVTPDAVDGGAADGGPVVYPPIPPSSGIAPTTSDTDPTPSTPVAPVPITKPKVTSGDDSGCAASPGGLSSASPFGGLALVLATALVARRRRRSA